MEKMSPHRTVGNEVVQDRHFDFSRVNPNPIRGDIKAACEYWWNECVKAGLNPPQKDFQNVELCTQGRCPPKL